MALLKTVIHVHTHYSLDSNQSPQELIDTARREGVHCVAVTDHDHIDGAFEAQALGARSDVQIVVGEEVSSAEGHVIGLFLKSWIQPGLSLEETIARIREQGGLVLVPHPFTLLCSHSLGRATARVIQHIDAIEILNAQNPLPWEDRYTARFATQHGLATYVGADAHLRGQLAVTYQWLPEFQDAAAFLAGLRQAQQVRGRYGVRNMSVMAYQHVLRRMTGRMAPGFGANAGAALTPRVTG